MERHIFKYGSFSYQYFVVRQDRKTVSLSVQPSLNIVLRCPKDFSHDKIEKFLKRKWSWLEKQIKYFKKFKTDLSKKEYISGESFLYLGRQYKLLVKKSSENRVILKYGQILLYTTNSVRNKKNNKEILEKWYLDRANIIFIEQYKKVIKNFSYNFEPRLIIRKMNKRWGSFLSDKKIILNPKLIQAPKECIDYVISHELCHMKHKNHDSKFYTLLKSKVKNWEEVKEKLELRFI
ncbi:M48 family metallopeptidase [Patescibacteria group bacterium]|nr:M48 family metallopeptidase [Patescibacteria group bacterium]